MKSMFLNIIILLTGSMSLAMGGRDSGGTYTYCKTPIWKFAVADKNKIEGYKEFLEILKVIEGKLPTFAGNLSKINDTYNWYFFPKLKNCPEEVVDQGTKTILSLPVKVTEAISLVTAGGHLFIREDLFANLKTKQDKAWGFVNESVRAVCGRQNSDLVFQDRCVLDTMTALYTNINEAPDTLKASLAKRSRLSFRLLGFTPDEVAFMASFFKGSSNHITQIQFDLNWQIKNLNKPCSEHYRLAVGAGTSEESKGYFLACAPLESLFNNFLGHREKATVWHERVNSRVSEIIASQIALEATIKNDNSGWIIEQFILKNMPNTMLNDHAGYSLNIQADKKMVNYLTWIATFQYYDKQTAALKAQLDFLSNPENLQSTIDTFLN